MRAWYLHFRLVIVSGGCAAAIAVAGGSWLWLGADGTTAAVLGGIATASTMGGMVLFWVLNRTMLRRLGFRL